MYFHRTVRDRMSTERATVQFDVYCACICANYRLSAQILTFTFAVKLLIDCRLAADVRVWRRCSIDVDVVVDRCRPDVDGGPLIRSIFLPTNLLSGLFAN